MSSDRMTVNTPAIAVATVSAARRPTAEQATRAAQATSSADTAAQPSSEAIKEIAQRIESYLRSVSRSLEFRVDAASGRTVVSVRDSETGDLIRQIPGEEVLRLAQMVEDQTIVLLNERA